MLLIGLIFDKEIERGLMIIESQIEETKVATEILKFEMEKAIKLSVPLKVNIAVGETWFDAKS